MLLQAMNMVAMDGIKFLLDMNVENLKVVDMVITLGVDAAPVVQVL